MTHNKLIISHHTESASDHYFSLWSGPLQYRWSSNKHHSVQHKQLHHTYWLGSWKNQQLSPVWYCGPHQDPGGADASPSLLALSHTLPHQICQHTLTLHTLNNDHTTPHHLLIYHMYKIGTTFFTSLILSLHSIMPGLGSDYPKNRQKHHTCKHMLHHTCQPTMTHHTIHTLDTPYLRTHNKALHHMYTYLIKHRNILTMSLAYNNEYIVTDRT